MKKTQEVFYAISIKQPWAALIAAGLKTVEVRTWSTSRRGRILIHAAKQPDVRAQGWKHITTRSLAQACEQRGGIIAVADLVDCLTYFTPEQFEADLDRHLNAAEWFQPPKLYGFQLASVQLVNFYNSTGNTNFFRVWDFPADSLIT